MTPIKFGDDWSKSTPYRHSPLPSHSFHSRQWVILVLKYRFVWGFESSQQENNHLLLQSLTVSVILPPAVSFLGANKTSVRPSIRPLVRRCVRYASSFSAITACLLAPRGQYWLLLNVIFYSFIFFLYIESFFTHSKSQITWTIDQEQPVDQSNMRWGCWLQLQRPLKITSSPHKTERGQLW